jgi:hypothetical protein
VNIPTCLAPQESFGSSYSISSVDPYFALSCPAIFPMVPLDHLPPASFKVIPACTPPDNTDQGVVVYPVQMAPGFLHD